MNRRQLLSYNRTGLDGRSDSPCGCRFPPATGRTPTSGNPEPLSLANYEPKSMLQVQETHVERARFPVIDIHTHISGSIKSQNGVELASEREYYGTPAELLAVMDRKNIRSMVNLTGGYGSGLAEAVRKYDRACPDRFYTFTEPSYSFSTPRLPEAAGPGHRTSSS